MKTGLLERNWVHQGKIPQLVTYKLIFPVPKVHTVCVCVCLTMSLFCSCRTIDLLDWNSLINDRTKISNLLVIPNMEVTHTQAHTKNVSKAHKRYSAHTNSVYSKEWSPGASVEQIHWWRGETDEEDATENGRPSKGIITKLLCSVDDLRFLGLFDGHWQRLHKCYDWNQAVALGFYTPCVCVCLCALDVWHYSLRVSWSWSDINQTHFLLWRKSVSFSLWFVFAHLFLTKET